MARYQPLWQQAGSYAATRDRSLIAALWPQGGATGGVVSAVANTMTVSAAPGTLAVPLQSGQGCALCVWDANEVVTIATAPPSGQSRIDLVIVQVRDNALDAGANNDFVMAVVAGTPAASNPAVPATPTNAAVLARVLIPGAVANLNTATVTDMRPGALAVPPRVLCATPMVGSPPPPDATLIHQYGTASGTAASDGGIVFNFPTPFPNGVLHVNWMGFGNGVGTEVPIYALNNAAGGQTLVHTVGAIYHGATGAPWPNAGFSFFWHALGW
jgi:hypothetical protein